MLRIGDSSNTGGIVISSSITRHTGFNTLDLITGNTTGTAITQSTTGSLSVANLALQSVGSVNLGQDYNDVDTLAAAVSGSGNYITFAGSTATGYAVGSVDGVTGISTTGSGGVVGLWTEDGGAVTQNSGDGISSDQLQLLSGAVFGSGSLGGNFTLNDSSNAVNTLAGDVSGNVSFTNSDSLIIGSVTATTTNGTGFDTEMDDGVFASGSITIATLAGNLTVSEAVMTSGGAVALTAGGAGSQLSTNAAIDTTEFGSTPAGANVTLNADLMSITAAINGGTGGTVTLAPVTATQVINLGTSTAGELGLTNTELGEVTAAQLIIGSAANTGGIVVTADITTEAGYNTLELLTGGGAITDPGGFTIDPSNLALSAATGIGTSAAPMVTAVSNLVALNTTSGGIFIDNTGDLTIGFTGEPFSGVQDTGAATDPITLTLNAGSTLTVGETVATTGGPITLTADDVVINAPIDAGTGSLTLDPVTASLVINLGTTVAGEYSVTNAELAEITAGTVIIGSTANTGGIVITADITASGYATLELFTGAAITDPGGFTIDPANLALSAATGIGTSAAR